MATTETTRRGSVDLDAHGLEPSGEAHWNLTTPELYEHTLRAGNGEIAQGGALVVVTAPNTGRSPKDKWIVDEPESRDRIWWGAINQPLAQERNEVLRGDLVADLNASPALYVLDAWAGAEPHRVAVRVVSNSAWHVLFAQTMFMSASPEEIAAHEPEVVILHSPE